MRKYGSLFLDIKRKHMKLYEELYREIKGLYTVKRSDSHDKYHCKMFRNVVLFKWVFFAHLIGPL